jgi:hypothetical protein
MCVFKTKTTGLAHMSLSHWLTQAGLAQRTAKATVPQLLHLMKLVQGRCKVEIPVSGLKNDVFF